MWMPRTAIVRIGRADAQPDSISYDALLVEPPQSAPDWLKSSRLAAAGR